MLNNTTIFAVDDEESILELYRKILGKRESTRLDFLITLEKKDDKSVCDLHTFKRGKEYLEALKKHYAQGKRVPLVIVDMRLPGMHGLEVAKETRKIDQDIAIVVVTAYSDYTVQELMGKLEHHMYYMRKPFKSDELYALVHSNLYEWNENIQAQTLHKELAIDAIQDGLWNWNPVTNLVYFSPRWKEMLGYEDHEIKNVFESWYSRVHPEDKSKVTQDINAHITGSTQYYVNEHRLRCKDGSYKWILSRGKALFDENNKPYKVTGFNTDITERKRLENELQSIRQSLSSEVQKGISTQVKLSHTNTELEKQLKKEIEKRREKEEMLLTQTRQAAMGEMISMIAHQWRQPLSIIGMIADNISLDLQFDTLDNSQLEESLKNIGTQVKYLSQTIDDFRQYSIPNKNKEKMLLRDCLEGTLQIIGKSLLSHNIELKKCYEDVSPILMYKNELIQVFINFLKNSQDAFLEKEKSNPQISIQTKEYETYIEILIEDNAGGIPLNVQKQIFQPYFTTKSKKNGTGLGLYMSKTIIEEHSGGTIRMENSDDGSIFLITFPKDFLEEKIEIFEDKKV
ncbi:MAG: PAS domain S-box-containing protein [Sulfurimonas sp.]|jgi:PAS domain S-box-containing protein